MATKDPPPEHVDSSSDSSDDDDDIEPDSQVAKRMIFAFVQNQLRIEKAGNFMSSYIL